MSGELPDFVMRRIERAGGQQSRGAPCLICKRDFSECPHDRGQIDTLLQAYRQQKLLAEMRWW